MVDTTALQSFVFSAEELAQYGFPDSFIEDYLNLVNNFQILATRFQMFKLGTQATTAAFLPLTGWTEDKNASGFILDSANGTIEIQETGQYEAAVWVLGSGTERIFIQLQLFNIGSSTWNDVTAAKDTNNISSQFSGIVFTASKGELLRVTIKDDGVSTNIDVDNARFSLGRKA